MKYLLILSVFASLSSFSQGIDGINMEHMNIWHQSAGIVPKNHTTKKAVLRTGVQLEYVEQGDEAGVPVLFVHGYPDSWHSYETVLPALPSTIHAFAVSLRGFGNSDKPDRDYSISDFANDLNAFMEAANIGPAIIVGHSMGSTIAQRLALDYPNRVSALVLIGSSPAYGVNRDVLTLLKSVTSLKSVDLQLATDFQKSTLYNDVPKWYFDTLVNEAMKVPLHVWNQALHGLVVANHTSELSKLEMPVLLVWGDKDGLASRNDQEILSSNIKRSQLKIYEDVGHSVHWEIPEMFAKDLMEYIVEYMPCD